jgi:hypothetical protein
MNYYDTLIEIADCPAIKGQVPQARGGQENEGSGRVRAARQASVCANHTAALVEAPSLAL